MHCSDAEAGESPFRKKHGLHPALRDGELRGLGKQALAGFIPSYCADPYVVVTHSDGGQGAFGYWICPVGDDSAGYLQPVWMAVM